jgi:hypothetical protein
LQARTPYALSDSDLAGCLAEVTPKEFPSDVDIQDLRQQLKFRWGSQVPLDARTGRPTTASTLWDRFNGSVQAAEPSGTGGWVVVPKPERNVPPGQLPPSYWSNKRAELARLSLCVERARLLRLLQDPVWVDRQIIRELNGGDVDVADGER